MKKALSIFLSLVLVIAALPLTAVETFAEENETSTVVSTLSELQAALNNDTYTEVIVSNAITLPDGTVLDGAGKTVRVEKPYVKEDGTLETSATPSRVFSIESGSHVSISNMTVMGGEKSGTAAISLIHGYLTMENVNVVRSNRGLDSNGTAILKNCNFSLNVCKSAGAIWTGSGAILVLDGCSFTNNRSNGGSSYGGGAIGLSGSGSYLYANNTVFANNASQEIGGAINVYDGNAYLMNCTVTGNCTSNSASCGGGIGKNGGSFYAVNCLFADNYATIKSTLTRSDIGKYSGSNSVLYNCLYGTLQGSATVTDCKTDLTDTVANEYANAPIMLSEGTVSVNFVHPVLSNGTNSFSEYVPVNPNGNAATGGVSTYFDYSDINNVKMGYGIDDNIVALGGLNAPDSGKKVTSYIEGGIRSSGVIGASDVCIPFLQYDINEDGIENINDIAFIISASVGEITLTTAQTERADLNADGVVDGFDAAELDRLMEAAGLFDWYAADSYYCMDGAGYMCLINGREYYKVNPGKAIIGTAYYECYNGFRGTGPILVSTDPDAVANNCSYYLSDIFEYTVSFEYLGTTWYAAGSDYLWENDHTSQRKLDGFYNSLEEAAIALLNTAGVAFGNPPASTNPWEAANVEYLMADTGNMCIINGRDYYKVNTGRAIIGTAYYYVPSANWSGTGPILVSTDPDAVANKCSYNMSFTSTYKISFEYLGLTWYAADSDYLWEGNHFSQRKLDGSYNSLEAAAKALIDAAGVTVNTGGSNTPANTVSIAKGDVNQDGEVNEVDYAMVKSYVECTNDLLSTDYLESRYDTLKTQYPEGTIITQQYYCADYDGDKAVDAFDLFYLDKRINNIA